MKRERCKNQRFQNTEQCNRNLFPTYFYHTLGLYFAFVCTNKSQRFGVLHFTSHTFVGVTDVQCTLYITNVLLHECVYWHMHLKTIQVRETP